MGQEQYRRRGRKPTLSYDTGEREDDALRRMQWVVPAVFLGAVLIAFFSVVEWVGPAMPAVLFAGLLWFPVTGILLVVDDGKTPMKFAAAVATLGLFGLPLLAWTSGSYRMAVREMLQKIAGFEVGAKALDDPHDPVATLACKLELQTGRLGQMEELKNALVDRPDVAADCLESFPEGGDGAAVRLAIELHGEWYDDWMTGRGLDVDRQCRRVRRSPEVARVYDQSGIPELLSCHFDAEREAVADCCGEVATDVARGDEPLEVEPTQWARSLEKPLFEALTEATEMPSSALRADEPFDRSLAWTPRQLFHWTVHLGCFLFDRPGESREGIAARLTGVTGRQCGLDIGEPLYSFSAVRFADRTCESIDGDSDRRIDVEEWCEEAEIASRETAVETAKFAVYDARRRFFRRAMATFILTGHWMLAEAARQAPFSRPLGRLRTWLDSDGLPLHRPPWVRNDREGLEQMAAVESDRRRRRAEARSELEDEVSEEELHRSVDRSVREEVRDDLADFRREYLDDEDDGDDGDDG